MGKAMFGHIRAHAVGYLALVVALSGTAYAAGGHGIDGRQIRRNSIPGNRVRPGSLTGNRLSAGTITGRQVDEASLGTVPSASHAQSADSAGSADRAATATRADSAATADRAATAADAEALGGRGPSGFGEGIVTGGIVMKEGEFSITPSGDFVAGSTPALAALAPVDMTIRDFRAQPPAGTGFTEASQEIQLVLEVLPPGSAVRTVPLCAIGALGEACRVAGPIQVAAGDEYQLRATGVALGVGTFPVLYAYRAAAG
jgi:hypothetical protein